MLAYAVRRLPYALRACMAALQQVHVSLEEAAESLGATKLRTIRRIVVPLMAGGILAGFVTSFITAAVELSATILLTSSRVAGADELRHLPLHAEHRRAAGRARRSACSRSSWSAIGTYASLPDRRAHRQPLREREA